jgi:hypothetical protein
MPSERATGRPAKPAVALTKKGRRNTNAACSPFVIAPAFSVSVARFAGPVAFSLRVLRALRLTSSSCLRAFVTFVVNTCS